MTVISCPICGREAGVTSGDQTFAFEICEACEHLRGWYCSERHRKVLEKLGQ